ncbi:MAG TPA: DUF1217 domain-containing protein [Rhodopila sp.]|jgi:hypothetical protein|nr:DUF1217 domain-containing protein [Rhodopila sp.]
MSSSLSYLTTLYADSFGGGSSLLDTIYGIGTSSAGSTNPVQALQQAEQNQTQDVAVTATQPMVKTAVAAFTQAVNSATSMTQLLANPAFMNVLLTANGMSDQIGYTALATQALTSNTADPNSLVNQLTDTRWKTLAGNYNFTSTGLSSFQNPSTIAAIANAFATATWQTQEDKVTPGLSNALAFKAQASTISSVDQILGNPTMRTVVTTALGIPEQIAFQDLGAQEQAISTRLGNVSQFQSPSFVESFVQKYLIANAASASSASSAPDLTTLAVQSQGILV